MTIEIKKFEWLEYLVLLSSFKVLLLLLLLTHPLREQAKGFSGYRTADDKVGYEVCLSRVPKAAKHLFPCFDYGQLWRVFLRELLMTNYLVVISGKNHWAGLGISHAPGSANLLSYNYRHMLPVVSSSSSPFTTHFWYLSSLYLCHFSSTYF